MRVRTRCVLGPAAAASLGQILAPLPLCSCRLFVLHLVIEKLFIWLGQLYM